MGIQEIEQAVTNLSPKELARFRQWFDEFDARAWDKQLEADAKSGKLDKIAEKAISEYHAESSAIIFTRGTPMTTALMDDKHMKDLMKQALVELFNERRELFSELFAELIEDAGLINAIREGENSGRVSEEEVMKALRG